MFAWGGWVTKGVEGKESHGASWVKNQTSCLFFLGRADRMARGATSTAAEEIAHFYPPGLWLMFRSIPCMLLKEVLL